MELKTIIGIIKMACNSKIYDTNNILVIDNSNPVRYQIFNNDESYIAFDKVVYKFNKIEITEYKKELYFKIIYNDFVCNIISNSEFMDLEIGL